MNTLEVLGFDPNSSEARRAQLLARNDRALLRELIAIRKERRISQEAVGRAMGITQPSVAAFESHDANPTLATIRRYAHAVGALVQHNVALDRGQLDEPQGVERWQTARLDMAIQITSSEVTTMPSSFQHAMRASRSAGMGDTEFALAV